MLPNIKPAGTQINAKDPVNRFLVMKIETDGFRNVHESTASKLMIRDVTIRIGRLPYLVDIREYLSAAIQPVINKARAAPGASFSESGCNAGTVEPSKFEFGKLRSKVASHHDAASVQPL